jgi:hypothetical protein
MSSSYICKKCNYKTLYFSDVKRHLTKRKQCAKKLEAFDFSEDQLLILTLLPYYNNIHLINNSEIEHLSKSTNLYNNIIELLGILEHIDKHKLKKCTYCNEDFCKMIDLRKHILTTCFYKEIEKKNQIKTLNSAMIDGDSNILNNQCNNNNTNNITNNIYIEIKNPMPFDGDWDISKIDKNLKTSLLFSKIMYTGLLEEILKNEINLNVIIDENNDSGMVYKNDFDKYIQMKSKDIVSNTMDKLRKHLLDINKEDPSFEEYLKLCSQRIEQKYDDYKNINKTNLSVNDFITNMFVLKKEDSIKVSKKVNNSNMEPQGF